MAVVCFVMLPVGCDWLSLGWLLDLFRWLLLVGGCLRFVFAVNSVVVGDSLFLLLFCCLLVVFCCLVSVGMVVGVCFSCLLIVWFCTFAVWELVVLVVSCWIGFVVDLEGAATVCLLLLCWLLGGLSLFGGLTGLVVV